MGILIIKIVLIYDCVELISLIKHVIIEKIYVLRSIYSFSRYSWDVLVGSRLTVYKFI